MADYKKMYYSLFNAVTKAIELLQNAQARTEELYIESSDTPLVYHEGLGDNNTDGKDD